MNINLTLFAQSISFAVFVWFCMKFVWPPIMGALEARRQQIADGLAAGERGRHEQELAQKRASEVLRDAKRQAQEIIAKAEKRAAEIIDEAKTDAKSEGERILVAARAEIGQEVNRAKEGLRAQVVSIAIAGAGKVLEREVDANTHNDLLNKLAAQI
jgi:F-type H+-transporting ATPase subunit b